MAKKCFLCNLDNGVIDFNDETFKNCLLKLAFRKIKSFKYNVVELNSASLEFVGYHSTCYKKVTALSKKYNEEFNIFCGGNTDGTKKVSIKEDTPSSPPTKRAKTPTQDEDAPRPRIIKHDDNEYQIFGNYVADEVRNMHFLKNKGELKRKILSLIIEYTEKDESEFLAQTCFERPESAESNEPPSDSHCKSDDIVIGSNPVEVKMEDPLSEAE